MFKIVTYIYKLYNQIKQIYQINTQLNIIFVNFNKDESDIIQNEKFESLKKIIFSCGSLYIKFFQWYISKLKSNIIDFNLMESRTNSETKSETDSSTDSSTDSITESSTYAKTDSETLINTDIINRQETLIKTKNLIKFIKYFEDIFEQCQYHDIEHTKQTFSDSMNGTLLEDYVDISSFKQIASGSIGQVYYAKRKTDNLEIAIKVKHPNIKEDLDNQYQLIKIIKFVQKISYFRNRYNLYFNLDDFLSDINLQCNFNNEANNCKIFQENFKESSNYIIFPNIIYQSEDLLISEYIEGESFEILSDRQKYKTSLNFICFFYQMLLVDNFLHGDLHCKNWKIKNNKETNTVQIVVYDCGICFQNTSSVLTSDFWFAIINYDIKALNQLIVDFVCDTNNNLIKDGDKLDKDINIFFNNVLNQSMSTSVLIKLIINFFSSNDIIVNKFLLNFSILICVIEEFLKGNCLIEKDKNRSLKRISMFEIINDYQLDMIAFCDVKKCYPEVRNIFTLDMKNKYEKYKANVVNNNIIEIPNPEKKLFSSLSVTKLKFKPPV